ncbi:ketol-acid reductoisomerase [Actinoplanes solisilvae]|uniref:ketol-acid reductoisomerase n=1 Tax=Actinoplanes solisilvae TaxID=2486853 RepID=UPI000FDB6020|nr:ketol-acid reductoisomerase [Actinoplanes solisilvae]
MVNIYRDQDADLSLIRGRRVAVIGYGSQGHAHALSLRDSGVEVLVGLPEGARSRAVAAAENFQVRTPAEASAWADVVMVLAPDDVQPALVAESILPELGPGQALAFAHGSAIRLGAVGALVDIDVILIAPLESGEVVRRRFVTGAGTRALIAVERDSTGGAFKLALSYARAIGATREGAMRGTVDAETDIDLFGEQALLAGGVAALLRSSLEILTEAGYAPEAAYAECENELKQIVELICRGDASRMPVPRARRAIDARVRADLRALLTEILTRATSSQQERRRPAHLRLVSSAETSQWGG